MLTNAPKGTKDILPNQVYKWQHVENAFREACDRYVIKEMRTPVFEHTELFCTGSRRYDGYRGEADVYLRGLREAEHHAEAGRHFPHRPVLCRT